MSERAAKRYADRVLKIPKSIVAKADLDLTPAERKRAVLERRYNALAKMDPTSEAFLKTATALASQEDLAESLDALGRMKPTPKAKLDAKEANDKIDEQNRRLTELGGRRPSPKVHVSATGVEAAQRDIEGIHGHTVYIDVERRAQGPNHYAMGGVVSPAAPHKAAAGWVVPGYAPRFDTVAAMLSPGEGVLTPEVVRALGPGVVDALNTAGMSGGLRQHPKPVTVAPGKTVQVTTNIYNPTGRPTETEINARAEMAAAALLGGDYLPFGGRV